MHAIYGVIDVFVLRILCVWLAFLHIYEVFRRELGNYSEKNYCKVDDLILFSMEILDMR